MLPRAARRLVDAWARIDQEAARERAGRPGFDWQPAIALVLVALVLIFEEYYGDRPNFEAWLGGAVSERWFALGSFAWWAAAKGIGYLLVPLAAVKLLGGRLADYGLGAGETRRHLRLCGAIYLALLPVIVGASFTAPFRATYPLYRLASRSGVDLVAWELMYGATFVALEFFFRGYLLFSLRRAMGVHAIFVMMVPYCMLHFHKPIAEVCGAIVAGIALGTLALVTRSIWCGVLLHLAAAWTMDALALAQTWGLPVN